jgi:arsenical pump membrane protein
MTTDAMTWGIAGLATAGVIIRPFSWPEAVWAVAGAVLLVVLGLMPVGAAWAGIARGADVYMFLTGMMLLSELARSEGLFDFLAGEATRFSRGSTSRLFLLVYLVGVVVTVFLSNDATAVVLTPAVFAATQAAKIDKPLPYLFICAFVANAASFVLPISNPANLVVFGGAMPPLHDWLRMFALPSLAAIVVTFAVLRFRLRHDLGGTVAAPDGQPNLTGCGKIAAAGIVVAALGLIVSSALGHELGAPTLIAGLLTSALVLLIQRTSPLPLIREISWGVLPLVAGLFIFVQALDLTGVTARLAEFLKSAAQTPVWGSAAAGGVIAFASNLVNNLPAGLVAASAAHRAASPADMTAAILIGVDLGPNLSVTGSLATILWLTALRREEQNVSAKDFLLLGAIAMPPALLLSLAALLL